MMNDTDLIDELREGIRERADSIEVPDAFATDVWRTARRRSVRRAVAAGVPGLAVAGVAVALVLGGGSATPRLAIPGANSSALQISADPVAHAQDTAYIVRRVRARLAGLAHAAVAGQGQVLESTSTYGDGTTAYPTVDNTDWMYIDPQSGVAYQRSVDSAADGTNLMTNALVTTPVNGVLHTQVTSLDPAHSTYWTTDHGVPGPSGSVSSALSGTQLGIQSTEQQIEQALTSDQVTQEGSATVDGQSTIELSVPPAPQTANGGLPPQATITLYVNAQTYEPVQEVDVFPNNASDPSAGDSTDTSNWLPTTAANIALAQLQIPGGYTQVSGPSDGYFTPSAPLTFMGY